MIKKTLYFGNPAYLRCRLQQLEIKLENDETKTLPIEDLGFVVLDHPQITISHFALSALVDNNVAVITCNATHHPNGLLLPLENHTLQSERYKIQVNASEPLKKQLWAQIVAAKINNQAWVLKSLDLPYETLKKASLEVKSGDQGNKEAFAASYYWKILAPILNPIDEQFKRERFGDHPNPYFNYAYALLRASMARSIVATGLLPTLGVFHRNKYNAYCLADDLMEPFRPLVDLIVIRYIQENGIAEVLSTDIKRYLLQVLTLDIEFYKETSPLMIATQKVSQSLFKCFNGDIKKMNLPKYKL